MKKIMALAVVVATAALAGCGSSSSDAQIASTNLSTAASQFEISRRIVFYNGISGEYILTIEGLCAIGNEGQRLSVTCKTGPNSFKKHFLGLSDNVTYFAEQIEPVAASIYHYRVIFKPASLLPDIQVK